MALWREFDDEMIARATAAQAKASNPAASVFVSAKRELVKPNC